MKYGEIAMEFRKWIETPFPIDAKSGDSTKEMGFTFTFLIDEFLTNGDLRLTNLLFL